jgi:hypothetical protein
MADAPQLLLAPESRKDKISKNDMRYLYRLEKGRQRSRKRAVVDKEIKNEKQIAEKKRRLSNANGEIKKLRKAASKLRGFGNAHEPKAGRARTKKSLEQMLLEDNMAVIEGDMIIPCIFDNAPMKRPTDAREELFMTLKEDVDIYAQDPKAVLWKQYDYGNIIPHEHLWVYCCRCRCGMPSTEIGYIEQVNWPIPMCKESQELTDYKIPPNIRWRLYHKTCWLLSKTKNLKCDESKDVTT